MRWLSSEVSSGSMTDVSPEQLRDLMMSTSRALRRRWFTALEPWELSPHEFRALRIIHQESGGRPRLGDVAKALRIAPRSATEVVDRLQKRDLVERVADDADRRAVCVQLTDTGNALLTKMSAARDAQAADFFAPLDARDRAELSRILDKLTADDC
ncbi:DNA-binding MarR family transcriptional regulator [Rhodococcus sp. LBL1]|uniref:DNA-binding MarR family transcriptional regulator n=2 Tax=Prescottella agglutinans TaxID=1644129 RepID=A0ABT6M8J4_9NOCA|nr:DNA-binding MarR family transcriptional regulator [Prescottella agglutinans]MDH6676685.1 DNA-binding MarR family transcriptional regulator [Rhodococcus sp. LBL1]MDH6681971.1 DNA-binding MarR family transcriptional regulator [Rhodococcus sp. LBL2]